MEWCVDRTKTRIAGENTLRRMRTRYVASGRGCPRPSGGRTCAEVGPWRTRKARAEARARKHAGGVLPAHGHKQPIDRYGVAQNLMEHGHGERE